MAGPLLQRRRRVDETQSQGYDLRFNITESNRILVQRIGAASMSQEQLVATFQEKETNKHKQDFYRFQTRENKVNRT